MRFNSKIFNVSKFELNDIKSIGFFGECYNVADFDLKNVLDVEFKKHNALDFESRKIQRVRF